MHVRTPCVGTLGGLQTAPDVVVGPRRGWRKPKPMTNGLKKSDEAVRPMRAANKGARACAESPEERASTKGNPERQSTRRTQRRASVPYCTTTRRGQFRLGRKPVAKRVSRTLARIGEVLRKRWHHDIWEVGRWLGRVYEGWLNYFAVPGSHQFIRAFPCWLRRLWMRALRRRSQRARFSWRRLVRMTDILWSRVSIRYPWPSQRAPSSTRGRSRMVQRPRPDLRGGCAAMRIPTVTGVKRRDRHPSAGRTGVRGRRLDVRPSMSATLTPRISVLPKWRRRFVERGVQGLHDELGPGQPRSEPLFRVTVALMRRGGFRTGRDRGCAR